MDNILSNIPTQDPILFFPVRLETRFVTAKNGDMLLKIRMIPDEIQIQYEVDRLTREDLEEGRRFWIQWFIASGDEEKEFDAWRQFCKKHGVTNASRIAAMTRMKNLSEFKKGGSKFPERPFAYLDADKNLVNITVSCQQIYDQLANVHISEGSVYNAQVTANVAEHFRAINSSLTSVSLVMNGYPDVVDFMYEKVNECVSYLSKRLDGIQVFYNRNSSLQNDSNPDWFAFKALAKNVTEFKQELSREVVSTEEKIDKYLKNDSFLQSHFSSETFKEDFLLDTDYYPMPTLPLLPTRFKVFCGGRTDGGTVRREIAGNSIPSNLQIMFDPHSENMGFGVSPEGDMTLPPGLRWMVDYDVAEKQGMAITVNFGKCKTVHVDYIYAFGVADNLRAEDTFHKLFKSHLYWKNNFSLLKVGTPTNLIDETHPSKTPDEEEIIKERYRLEVLEETRKLDDGHKTDGMVLRYILDADGYKDVFSRIPYTDNTELDDAMKANEALWDYFEARMIDPNRIEAKGFDINLTFFTQLRKFFLKYVNARGVAPVFRMDDLPYGIVPVSDLNNIKFNLNCMDRRYLRLIFEAVQTICNRWLSICAQNPLSADTMSGKNAHRHFLEMISQSPRSLHHYKRVFYHGPREKSDADKKGLIHTNELTEILSALGMDDPIPVADTLSDYDISDLKQAVMDKLPHIQDWQAERLVCEFLDTFTYRVDVWFTAIMSYYINFKPEFRWIRRVGSYGWVFNLKNNPGSDSVAKGEYVMAPSIQHALTAAVLRSAYLQTKATEDDTHMCINLSSMRARQALRMIEGIKAGMSTGMILGADLERYLHDAKKVYGEEMDLCIAPLRQAFPQVFEIKAQDNRADDYAMQTINGEALLNEFLSAWDNKDRLSNWLWNNKGKEEYKEAMAWFNEDTKLASLLRETQQRILFKLIERMADSYDALNDLLLAEGVHRLVAGDKASFAAIANFMAKGNGNLPDPAVLETPMEYAVLAHNAGLALPRTYAKDGSGVLTKADPSVSAWITSQMGALENVVFHVDFSDGDQRSFFDSNLQEIGLEPIELLHLSSYPKVFGQMLELAWRAKDWENRKKGRVRILTGDSAELEEGEILPDIGPDQIRLYEFGLLMDSLSSLLGRSRSLRGGDFIPSISGDAAEEKLMNLNELKNRYQSVYKTLHSINEKLASDLASLESKPLDDAKVQDLFDAVSQCTRSGLFNETVAYDTSLLLDGIDPILQRPLYDKVIERQQEFLAKLTNMSAALSERLAKASEIVPANAATLRASAYIEAIQTLTFKNLKITCRFSMKPNLSEFPFEDEVYTSMAKDYNNAKNLKGDQFSDWMDEISEVRPGMKLYHEKEMLQQLWGHSGSSRKVGIFQTQSSEQTVPEWLGCPVSDESMVRDTDSLVLFDRQNFDLQNENSGLVFDFWLEYIPLRKQTAGLVYRCDIPDAEAPQAILYTLYPKLETNKKWKDEEMAAIFSSAVQMFKVRTVDPDQIISSSGNSLLGSLLSARKEKLVDIDTTKTPEQQIKDRDAALKKAREVDHDLILDERLMKKCNTSFLRRKK
jgi:hypothetical protein